MSITQAQELLKELVDLPKEMRLSHLKYKLDRLSIDLSDAFIKLNEAYIEMHHLLKRQQQFVPAYLINQWRMNDNYKTVDHWEEALIPLFEQFILDQNEQIKTIKQDAVSVNYEPLHPLPEYDPIFAKAENIDPH